MKTRADKVLRIVLVLVLLGILTAKVSSRRSDTPEKRSTKQGRLVHTSQPRLAQNYGKLPLSFELNKGQTDSQVKFLSRGGGYTIFLTQGEAVLSLKKPSAVSNQLSAVSYRRSALRNWKLDNRNWPGINLQSPIFNRQSLLPSPASLLGKDETRKWKLENRQFAIDNSLAPGVLRMKLVAANAKAKVAGLDPLPGKSNYFLGNDPKKWRTNVPTYAEVKYATVYPGVDLVYYGNQGQLEYDFVVAPGADPKVIALEMVGEGSALPRAAKSRPFQIDASGDLVIAIEGGEARFYKPVVYQPTGSNPTSEMQNRKAIDGHYVLLAEGRIGFDVPNYDKTKALVIDPVLAYSSYLGGSGDEGLGSCAGIAVDSDGNAYVVGGTTSIDFPTTKDSVQPTYGGGPVPSDRWYACGDAFVSKVDPTGSTLVYSTYLGGTGCESSSGIGVAVDSQGSAYVTGITASTDFPVTPGAFQTSFRGWRQDGSDSGDAFVTKISPDGSRLEYSTYLGGSGNEVVDDTIAVDPAGNAYVGGTTDSTDFPTTPGAFQTSLTGTNCADKDGNPLPCPDVFVTKLNATGSSLIYSTLIGGSNWEDVLALGLDASGNVWVTGSTGSSDYPTTAGAYQKSSHRGGCGEPPIWDCDHVFVTKLNAHGSALIYSTYLDGTGGETPIGIAGDSSGNAYLTGVTSSPDFPTTLGAFRRTPPSSCPAGSSEFSCGDAFVAKIDPTKTGKASLVYSTFLGGSGNDWGDGIAVDSFGNAYVTGVTWSTDFPTKNPIQSTNAGAADVFVTKLNATGSDLIYSTYLGGANSDLADWLAVDGAGNPYLAGWTESTNFPTTSGAFQPAFGGGTRDFFVAKLDSRTFVAEIQPPIEADGSSVFNAKRGVVPVKFALAADGAPTCDLYPATIALLRIGGETPVAVSQDEFVMPSDEGVNFRITGCQYHYNLGTSSLGAGTYLVQININGSKVGEAKFSLK